MSESLEAAFKACAGNAQFERRTFDRQLAGKMQELRSEASRVGAVHNSRYFLQIIEAAKQSLAERSANYYKELTSCLGRCQVPITQLNCNEIVNFVESILHG